MVSATTEESACDLLARKTNLSKTRIKDCMHKGGVWIKGPGHKNTRLRRATAKIWPGQTLEIYYNAKLLAQIPEQPQLIFQTQWYSIWNKPAGVLAQGTRYTDHCALPRLTQIILNRKKELHPVHRLDREAQGLVLMAHNPTSAHTLGELFKNNQVLREYQVLVHGIPLWESHSAEQPLHGKTTLSKFVVVRKNEAAQTTLLCARIETGRTHQIRRHLAELGYPVVGDYRYGHEPRAGKKLQLLAQGLGFWCPWSKSQKQWTLAGLPSTDQS